MISILYESCREDDPVVAGVVAHIQKKRPKDEVIALAEFSNWARDTGYIPIGGRMWQARMAPPTVGAHQDYFEYIFWWAGHYVFYSYSERKQWTPEQVMGALLQKATEPSPTDVGAYPILDRTRN